MSSRFNAFWVSGLVLLVSGCGGKSDNDASSTGGTAGSAGSGGSAGTAGAAGNGGSGGSAGSGQQCTDASECKLFSDCCTCVALGPGEPEPPACLATCLQDSCSAMGVKSGQASCAVGKCVVGFDCEAGQVFCNALPPVCEAGLVPSVTGGCWGPCVPATQCASVPSCLDCTGPLTTCVSIDTQGAESGTHHCVDVPKGCEGNPTCSCMGASVCTGLYSACQDLSGLPGMVCSCPNC